MRTANRSPTSYHRKKHCSVNSRYQVKKTGDSLDSIIYRNARAIAHGGMHTSDPSRIFVESILSQPRPLVRFGLRVYMMVRSLSLASHPRPVCFLFNPYTNDEQIIVTLCLERLLISGLATSRPEFRPSVFDHFVWGAFVTRGKT